MLNIYHYLKPMVNKYLIQLGMIAVSILAAFGVYIGRYQRWNSWDIVDTPYTLLKDCFHLIKHSTSEISFFCLLFGGIIYASYALLNRLTGVEERV